MNDLQSYADLLLFGMKWCIILAICLLGVLVLFLGRTGDFGSDDGDCLDEAPSDYRAGPPTVICPGLDEWRMHERCVLCPTKKECFGVETFSIGLACKSKNHGGS